MESGRPRYGVDLDETVIPQEAGLNERAVSFTKGCYVGQETVARLFYKGKPNRHLRGLRLSAPVAPGTPLLLAGREVGRVSSAVSSPRLGPIGLALVRREAEPGDVLDTGEGAVRRRSSSFRSADLAQTLLRNGFKCLAGSANFTTDARSRTDSAARSPPAATHRRAALHRARGDCRVRLRQRLADSVASAVAATRATDGAKVQMKIGFQGGGAPQGIEMQGDGVAADGKAGEMQMTLDLGGLGAAPGNGASRSIWSILKQWQPRAR